MEFLAEYDFGIEYIKRKENKVESALIHRQHINSMIISQFDLLDQVDFLQQEDPHYRSI